MFIFKHCKFRLTKTSTNSHRSIFYFQKCAKWRGISLEIIPSETKLSGLLFTTSTQFKKICFYQTLRLYIAREEITNFNPLMPRSQAGPMENPTITLTGLFYMQA